MKNEDTDKKTVSKKRLLIKIAMFRCGEFVPWIKVLPTKPADLNLIPGTWHTHTCAKTQNKQINVI